MTADGMRRLTLAMELFYRHQDASPEDRRRVVAEHPELAMELEPLLLGESVGASEERRCIGGFELVKEIGHGGMGVVYEAIQVSLQRKVALKLLAPQLVASPSALARFRREAQIIARLDHPNILGIHAVGDSGGEYYFAAELVTNGTLAGFVGPLRERVEIVVSIADALSVAHAVGVIHRDIKPTNILIRQDGTPVLADFGLARSEDFPELTQTGVFTGTACYAAPEQVEGKTWAVDARTDVFGLGVTLYELVCGRRAFTGETVPRVLEAILKRDPPDPLRVVPDLAPDLAAIVTKAIEKDPARRYQTAAAFAADLRAFLEFRPVTARRIGLVRSTFRYARREPWKAALVATLLLGVPVVSLLIGYVLSTRADVEIGRTQAHAEHLEELLAEAFYEMHSGSSDRARAVLEEARTFDPTSREVEFGLEMLTERARPAASRPSSADSAPDPLTSTDALSLCFSGVRALERGERGEAAGFSAGLELLRRAVQMAPKARFLYHSQWAHAAGHAGTPAEQAEAANAIEALWPARRLALFWAAFALRESSGERAIAVLRRAAALEPGNVAARTQLARLLCFHGHSAEALAVAESAVKAEPGNGDALWVLADALRVNGKDREALAAYDEVVKILPTIADPCVRRADLRLKWGEPKNALPDLRNAARIEPANALVSQKLASALKAVGDSAEARTELMRALEIEPRNRPVILDLLKVCQELDGPEGVRALLDRVVDDQPEWADLNRFYVLGLCRESRMRDFERARNVLWRSIELRKGGESWDWMMLGMIGRAQGDHAAEEFAFAEARRRGDAEGRSLTDLRAWLVQTAVGNLAVSDLAREWFRK